MFTPTSKRNVERWWSLAKAKGATLTSASSEIVPQGRSPQRSSSRRYVKITPRSCSDGLRPRWKTNAITQRSWSRACVPWMKIKACPSSSALRERHFMSLSDYTAARKTATYILQHKLSLQTLASSMFTGPTVQSAPATLRKIQPKTHLLFMGGSSGLNVLGRK